MVEWTEIEQQIVCNMNYFPIFLSIIDYEKISWNNL